MKQKRKKTMNNKERAHAIIQSCDHGKRYSIQQRRQYFQQERHKNYYGTCESCDIQKGAR